MRHEQRRGAPWAALLLAAIPAVSCGGTANTPPAPTCDQACQDAGAVLGLRQAMKLLFNLTLQGKPVGAEDATGPCPLGGQARVYGTATSNAVQGATMVDLTYVFTKCAYAQKDPDPTQTYSLTVDGTVTEAGTLAVQPSSTTALDIKSDAISITGSVSDPPLPIEETSCPLVLGQNGNQLSGTMCGRAVGVAL